MMALSGSSAMRGTRNKRPHKRGLLPPRMLRYLGHMLAHSVSVYFQISADDQLFLPQCSANLAWIQKAFRVKTRLNTTHKF